MTNIERLIDATVLNARALIYAMPAAPLVEVFDGDVRLEPECYAIDAARGDLTLLRPAAARIRFLVGSVSENPPRWCSSDLGALNEINKGIWAVRDLLASIGERLSSEAREQERQQRLSRRPQRPAA